MHRMRLRPVLGTSWPPKPSKALNAAHLQMCIRADSHMCMQSETYQGLSQLTIKLLAASRARQY